MQPYKYIYYADGEYAFLNTDTNLLEFFVANKSFAGWTLKFRNTRLEFTRSYNESEMQHFKDGLTRIHRWGEQHPGFKQAYRIMGRLGMK